MGRLLYGHSAISNAGHASAPSIASGRRVVRVEAVPCSAAPGAFVEDGPISFALVDGTWWIRYRDGATFGVAEDRILVDPGQAWESDERFGNQIMGLWLRRRGFAVLHANAVVRDGRAVLLMGGSGAGKSTLTRALLDRGYAFGSDDLGVVDVNVPVPQLMPGPGRLKMRPVDGGDAKVPVVVTADPAPVPLVAIFVLVPGSPVSARSMGGKESLLELVRHAHMPRSMHATQSETLHFNAVSRLAKVVPTIQLVRGTTLHEVDRAIDAIEAQSPIGPTE